MTLKFDMPGVAKENLDITADKDTLTIISRGEPEEGGNAVYRETHVADYRRQFTLSPDLDPNNVTATMNDGILVVAIGKSEQAKPRKVKVAAAG